MLLQLINCMVNALFTKCKNGYDSLSAVPSVIYSLLATIKDFTTRLNCYHDGYWKNQHHQG